MNKLTNTVYLLFLLVIGACTEDVPNPAFPDINSIPAEPIKAFALIGPESGLSINVKPSSTVVSFIWNAAEGAETYEWLLDELDGDFSTPLLTVAVIPKDGTSDIFQLDLTYTQFFELLGDAGVEEGAVVKGKWTVRAKAGANTRLAQTAKGVTIQRAGVTFTIHVPANTPANYDIFIAGEFSFLPGGADWQNPGTNPKLKMAKNSNGTYSVILGVPNGESFEYKYYIVPTGTSTLDNPEMYPAIDATGIIEAPNRSFTYNGANDSKVEVVSFWAGFEYPYLVFNVDATGANTPVDKDVFIAGEMTKLGAASANWQKPGSNSRLTLTRISANSFFIVFPLPVDGTALQYKYAVSVLSAGGSYDNEQVPTGNRNYTYSGSNPVIADVVTKWKGI